METEKTEQLLINKLIRLRFLGVLHHLNLNREETAKKLGCHENVLIEIEKDQYEFEINDQIIFTLCEELNVNLNWLFLGVGRMFQPTTEQSADEDFDKEIRGQYT